jgi:hypothetical protein
VFVFASDWGRSAKKSVRVPTQDVNVGFVWRQTDCLVEVLQSRVNGAALEVQLAAVLECLPQLRAQADGFRQKGNPLVGLPGRSELDGSVQECGVVRDNPETPPAADVEVRREDEAQAR